jgi:hypothetical protein
MLERLLNAIASVITIGLFIATYVLHGFSLGESDPSIEMAVETRAALFLLTQMAVAYLAHVTVSKIPPFTAEVKAWLIASTTLIIAQWATMLSLRLFYPECSDPFRIGVFVAALVFHVIILRKSSSSADEYPLFG